MPTDAEASKYLFLNHLEHYMERALIREDNRKAVELVVMVEAGTTVREMDPMKKEAKEKAFLNSYVSIIQEIPDERLNMELLAQRCSFSGNLSRLPSGTAQLQQMKCPLIIKLWKEKYPAERGVDYDDNISVWANIPEGWWLNHDICKYILSCLVHKDNKDISTKPTQQPPVSS